MCIEPFRECSVVSQARARHAYTQSGSRVVRATQATHRRQACTLHLEGVLAGAHCGHSTQRLPLPYSASASLSHKRSCAEAASSGPAAEVSGGGLATFSSSCALRCAHAATALRYRGRVLHLAPLATARASGQSLCWSRSGLGAAGVL